MRSAGCIANDLADRKIDAFVERTKSRPIASGIVKLQEARILLLLLLVFSFLLVIQLNFLTIFCKISSYFFWTDKARSK